MTRNVTFKADEIIFSEGDDANEMYVIRKGKVRISRGGTVLDDIGRSAFFGEMSLIDKRPRSATAIAMEPTECTAISAEDLHNRLHASDPLMQGVFRVLVERIRKLNRKLAQNHNEAY